MASSICNIGTIGKSYPATSAFKCCGSTATVLVSHYFVKIKIDSYDSLPIEKRLSFDNAIIHIKPVLNKDKNLYLYYKMFLEKFSNQ